MSGRVVSPCNDVCHLDRGTGWCLGCGRTGDEIMRWIGYDDTARDAVMAALPERLAAMGLPLEARARQIEGMRRARAQRTGKPAG